MTKNWNEPDIIFQFWNRLCLFFPLFLADLVSLKCKINKKYVSLFFRLTLNANEDYSSSDSDEEFISRLDLSFESDNQSVDSIPSDTKCVTELSKLQI